jgi:hypothetical protein
LAAVGTSCAKRKITNSIPARRSRNQKEFGQNHFPACGKDFSDGINLYSAVKHFVCHKVPVTIDDSIQGKKNSSCHLIILSKNVPSSGRVFFAAFVEPTSLLG